jgi:hypothetical protein
VLLLQDLVINISMRCSDRRDEFALPVQIERMEGGDLSMARLSRDVLLHDA